MSLLTVHRIADGEYYPRSLLFLCWNSDEAPTLYVLGGRIPWYLRRTIRLMPCGRRVTGWVWQCWLLRFPTCGQPRWGTYFAAWKG